MYFDKSTVGFVCIGATKADMRVVVVYYEIYVFKKHK